MRIKTGINGMDELIQGGLIENRVYTLAGPPGAGKTTFGVQFLAAGAAQGDVGLYISLVENPINIVEDMSNYSFNVKNLSHERKLFFMDMGPLTHFDLKNSQSKEKEDIILSPTVILDKIETVIKKINVKRLVIDSVMTIKFGSVDPYREKKEMTRFVRSLKDFGCTTIMLSEMTEPDAYTVEHFLAHGVIFMHNFFDGGDMTRALQIIKMRGTKHDCSMRRILFRENGISILPQKLMPVQSQK